MADILIGADNDHRPLVSRNPACFEYIYSLEIWAENFS